MSTHIPVDLSLVTAATYREYNDKIHGSIRLPPVIFEIMDTPEFQRLRKLKQLGLCDLVFPNADHSRFVHSIGVCYLAGKFVEVLRRKQPSLNISDKDKLCLMIAGLLHDIGHGPFSHTFDGRYMPMARPNKKWTHEDGSVMMFDHLFKNKPSVKINLKEKHGLTERDFTFIKECISGPKEENKHLKWPKYAGRNKDKCFLFDIISNRHDGLDVDRFDYFLRDKEALNLDVRFGKQTLERLFHNARVMYIEDGVTRICYAADKVMKDLASVGSTRFRLHEVAYSHKTTVACELMMCDILVLAGEHILTKGDDGEFYALADCTENMGAYIQLKDSSLISRIEFPQLAPPGINHQRDKDLAAAVALINRMDNRDLYVLVSSLELEDGLKDLAVKLNTNKRKFVQEMATIGHFDPEQLRIAITRKHFGMRDQYPLSHVRKYDHKAPQKPPDFIPAEQFPPDFPTKYDVYTLRVYSTTHDTEVRERIERAFGKWTDTYIPKKELKRTLINRTISNEDTTSSANKKARCAENLQA